MNKKALALGLVFSIAFAAAKPVTAKSGDSVLNAVRLINTAEAYAHRTNAKYLPLEDLISTGSLQQAAIAGTSAGFDSTYSGLDLQHPTELINGFDFALLVSSDGSTYKFSLVQKGNCGPAYFSDERGIIYTGRALGCSAK